MESLEANRNLSSKVVSGDEAWDPETRFELRNESTALPRRKMVRTESWSWRTNQESSHLCNFYNKTGAQRGEIFYYIMTRQNLVQLICS